MAITRKGARRIVIGEVVYVWRIRQKATISQSDYGHGKLHVAVQLAQNPGSVLIIYTDRPHPEDWSTKEVTPVIPSDIADWIQQAIKLGWDPVARGAQFNVKITATSMEQIA